MRKINTEDVFKMARIIKNTSITGNIKKAFSEGKKEGADAEQIGIDVFMDIVCSCADESIEKKFYDLIGGITEKKPEDIKQQSLETTIDDIKRICEENNIINFFKSAARLSSKIQE